MPVAPAEPDVAALKAAADRAMAGADFRRAAELLGQAAALAPRRPDLWLAQAAALRAAGDLQGALLAVDGALGADPRSFAALLMKASLMERLGAAHGAGEAYGTALTQAPPDEALPPPMRAAVAHAREVHARYQDELGRNLRANLGLGGAGPVARRLETFVDRLSGRRQVFHQAPVQFHYPGLPELEFHDREAFPCLEQLERATDDIRGELVQLLSDDAEGLEPYVNYPDTLPLDQWAGLNRSPAWSAYHLWKYGAKIEAHARRCPRTMAAIGALPQPVVPRRSPAAMFSVLSPHTRIPPHTGVANTRLVLHLPLIVPEGCGFRVGSETRPWKVGEAWVFDDTVEHEAWNDSDDIRIILICDVWNPLLGEEERELIARVMAAMDAFAGATPGGDGL
jgi:aspartate beta-hydroxylase